MARLPEEFPPSHRRAKPHRTQLERLILSVPDLGPHPAFFTTHLTTTFSTLFDAHGYSLSSVK